MVCVCVCVGKLRLDNQKNIYFFQKMNFLCGKSAIDPMKYTYVTFKNAKYACVILKFRKMAPWGRHASA